MIIMEITEDKINKMSEYAEKMLRYGGKLMECLEELGDHDSEMGMRRGMRDDDGYYEQQRMGMRRGYSRYR